MRLVTFRSGGRRRPGLVRDGAVVELSGAFDTMLDAIAAGAEAIDARGPELPLDGVELCAPLEPRNVFAVGWNYLRHFEEGAGARGQDLPEHPPFFSKATGAVIGHEEPIPLHARLTSSLDYEAELAVLIGAPGADIASERALDHVFGYTVANDVSARDVQRRHGGQWLKGKSLDGTCPLGPWIVTADEVADPQMLEVSCRVNREERQRASTAQMIFTVAELISHLSAGMTLQPGDVLLTGTPEGVGMGFDPPRFLRTGDVVECEVSSVGVLRNVVGS